MRSLIGSQCKLLRTGVMWSRVPIPATSLAAAFWTRWSGSIDAWGSVLRERSYSSRAWFVTKADTRPSVTSLPRMRRTDLRRRRWKKQLRTTVFTYFMDGPKGTLLHTYWCSTYFSRLGNINTESAWQSPDGRVTGPTTIAWPSGYFVFSYGFYIRWLAYFSR